jgi:DNA-binding CsgD family transcriptional regulator
MERLRQRDLLALLAYLREIYAHRDLGSFGATIVSTLPEVLSSEWTSYNEVDTQRRTITWAMEPFPSEFLDGVPVFEQHIPEHPLIAHYQQTRDGQALKISDFLTRRQFHRLGLYNEFYRRLEVEHQMAVILPSPAPLVIGIAVNRSGGDFAERDRLLFNLLRLHLVQAYENAGAATRLRQAVEGSDLGVVFLAKGQRVGWCTERARGWLSEYFEPSRSADGLPESLQRWIEHQRSLLSYNGDAPPPRQPLILEQVGKRLVVRLVAGRHDEQEILLLEEQAPSLSAGSLEALGLTRREVEILLHVAQGKTNAEVASSLYVSPLTVKKHLEHIYQKLGVESRTEALARVLKLAE